MSKPGDTRFAWSCNPFANINTAWPDCSDLGPWWFGRDSFLYYKMWLHSLHITTESLLANSCLMTSQLLEEKKSLEASILRFTFCLIILGRRGHFCELASRTGARHRGQTVLLLCGKTGCLKWECIVTATRPLILMTAEGANAWPLKATQPGESFIQEQTRRPARRRKPHDIRSDIATGDARMFR